MKEKVVMKTYEKPMAEVVDFSAEKIMDGGMGEGVETSPGYEFD